MKVKHFNMKNSFKLFILLAACASLFGSSCKKNTNTPSGPSFDQITLADIKAHETDFNDPSISNQSLYFNDPSKEFRFKVGSIIVLKNTGPTVHYGKVEILSVNASTMVFNYMAYNDDGSILVPKKEVTVTAGINTFASWTGGPDGDAGTCSLRLNANPIYISGQIRWVVYKF